MSANGNQGAGREIEAGSTTYLMNELTNARVRCDQLVRYLNEAVRLVDKSSCRDHFYEVAGHLLEAVPKTALELQKALDATTLAAGILDYDETKALLHPDKVEQIEQAMKDLRLRQVRRRTEPMMIDQRKAASAIDEMITESKTGSIPVGAILSLAEQLDGGSKTASSGTVVEKLEAIRDTLVEAKSGETSRVQIARLLREIAGEAVTSGQVSARKTAADVDKATLTKLRTLADDIAEDSKALQAGAPSFIGAGLKEIQTAAKDMVKLLTRVKTAKGEEPETVPEEKKEAVEKEAAKKDEIDRFLGSLKTMNGDFESAVSSLNEAVGLAEGDWNAIRRFQGPDLKKLVDTEFQRLNSTLQGFAGISSRTMSKILGYTMVAPRETGDR